ncbi:MAG TPA: EAL domain-containing protein [Kineosporiaceae bacterium]|nr:EAL domain-containing protein [Kineosporiaceae bacterium]
MDVILRWSPMAGLLFTTAALDLVAAGWVWRRRGAAARVSLAALLVAAAVWCAAYSLELATVGRTGREVWGDLEYLGTTLLPPAWLAFVLEYTGRCRQLTRRLIGALVLEPLALATFLIIPATHDLVRAFAPGPVAAVPVVVLGPAYWVHYAYTTALTLLATVLLVARLLRVSSMYRRQSLTLAVAVAVPLIGNTASSFGLPLSRQYDLTPVAVSVGGLVLVWGAFRYRLLDLLPVARTLAFDRLGDPILVVDAYGRIVDRNPAAAALLGPGAVIGATMQDLLRDQAAVLDATPAGAEIRIEHGPQTLEYELVASALPDHSGRRAGQLLHLRDITARKHAERRLRYLAQYDQLTRLPNRGLLADRLDQAIVQSRRSGRRCALILLDLDRFKLINDSLGHEMGDHVLAQVGHRLRVGRRAEDTAARLGGDEFALLLPEIAAAEDARLVARQMLTSLAEPMHFGTNELIVTASAGVAVWPDDGSDPQQLFGCADAAMYRAKARGRNRAESGALAAAETGTDRLQLGVDLWHAVRRGELRLLFQPMVSLHDGALLGMEALLRWQHPRLGLLTPGAFLAVAEESGLTTELDRWVLAQACGQACRWSRGGRTVPVSVNVSAQGLRADATLRSDVALILERTTLPPELLILEINERSVIDEPEPVAEELHRLRALGVGLALDDFGTGHTSLTHLRRLPINILKIENDLVRGATNGGSDPGDSSGSRDAGDTDGQRILSAVATLAHVLGMTVVAEGVETQEPVATLQRTGCDAAQGLLFSSPVDPEAADALITDRGLALSLPR